MKLTKQMLAVADLAARGHETITDISASLGKSVNWVSEVVSELAEEDIAVKEKVPGLHRSRLKIRLASTPYAQKLKELLFQYRTIDFGQLLAGAKLDMLAALCFDWKDFRTVSGQTGLSMVTLRIYAKPLLSRGVLVKKGRLYMVNGTAWPKLQEFLQEYRNFSAISGDVKWKFGDEVIFAIDEEKLKQGVYTGLSRYNDFGVKVGMVKALCHVPARRLSKEEIFVHSLLEVDDSRTLHLAVTFYVKNRLRKAKSEKIAIRYDLFTKFEEFSQLLSSNEEKLKVGSLPAFERKHFRKVAEMYGVKSKKKNSTNKRVKQHHL